MNITIDTIFRLCNFLLVIGLVMYLVRRYGILFVVGLMRQEREQKQSFRSNLKKLQKDYAELEVLTKEQEVAFKQTQKKFKQWTQIVENEQQQEQEVLEKRKIILEHKQVQRIHSLQQRKLIKEQLPELLQEVEKDLQKEFENSKQAQVYTSKLLRFLDE